MYKILIQKKTSMNLDVVLGIGAINKVVKAGYRRYERKDLIEDILIKDKSLNNNDIVNVTFTCFIKEHKISAIL